MARGTERADVVFTGTLVEVTPPPARLSWSSGDPATYSFDVERVHQGDIGPSTEVRSAVSGASCGLEGMQTGSRYVVFATLDDGLWANLCGGTDLARPGVVRGLLASVAGLLVAAMAVRSRVSSSGPGSTSRGARPGAARTPGGSWARRRRARSARGGRPTWPRR
jgi:hypothetical protein